MKPNKKCSCISVKDTRSWIHTEWGFHQFTHDTNDKDYLAMDSLRGIGKGACSVVFICGGLAGYSGEFCITHQPMVKAYVITNYQVKSQAINYMLGRTSFYWLILFSTEDCSHLFPFGILSWIIVTPPATLLPPTQIFHDTLIIFNHAVIIGICGIISQARR